VDDILKQDGDNIVCLMNSGYILQASTRWAEAGAMFARVGQLIPDDVNDGLRAKEECAWCQVQDHDLEGGVLDLKNVLESLNGLDHRDSDQARCLWRLGKCHLEMGGKAAIISYDLPANFEK
jgi:superkiller protein 3